MDLIILTDEKNSNRKKPENDEKYRKLRTWKFVDERKTRFDVCFGFSKNELKAINLQIQEIEKKIHQLRCQRTELIKRQQQLKENKVQKIETRRESNENWNRTGSTEEKREEKVFDKFARFQIFLGARKSKKFGKTFSVWIRFAFCNWKRSTSLCRSAIVFWLCRRAAENLFVINYRLWFLKVKRKTLENRFVAKVRLVQE